jgi:hypothetical protein
MTPYDPSWITHGEIVTRDYNGYSLYVCADCGQSINRPDCPAREKASRSKATQSP